MNCFPDELLLRDLGTVGGTQVFELLADFRYFSKKYGEIVVPKGTKTNGISSPRFIWPYIGPTSDAFKISVVHDYLFSRTCKYQNITNKQADEIMLEGMKELGIRFVKRQMIYRSLQAFSWTCWRKAD